MDSNEMPRGPCPKEYLGPELPFQNQQQQQKQWNHHHQPNFHQQQQHHLFPFSQNEAQYFQSPMNESTNPHLTRSNQQLMAIHKENPRFHVGDGGNVDGVVLGSSSIPYQRVKWTDDMVRLLIVAVYIVDYHNYGNNEPSNQNKKECKRFLQKKGKWECVSSAMIEKGYFVSTNQCEDKFNELNKKYKRVIDILGKGTACKVVENPRLLDCMDHLSAKKKEEVSTLLNSKQLFFKDMCAYHNSGIGCSSALTKDNHTEQSKITPRVKDKDDVNGNNGVDYSNADIEETAEEGEDYGSNSNKSAKVDVGCSQSLQELRSEMMGVFQDGSKTQWEKMHWLRSKLMELQELRAKYQVETLRLSKDRMSWIKYRARKEMEMETRRHELERAKLNNEKMLHLLWQKECKLIELQQQQQQQQQSTQMFELPPIHD